MRKVNKEHDNPVESIILDMGDKIIPFFKNTGHTPNMLTTYSFILGLVSVYFLYNNQLFKFSLCFFISFVFDCWDGHMARKYNMTSKFGDLYDHISDIIVGLSIFYVSYTKYKHKITLNIVLLVSIMTYLMHKHIACYQQYYINSNKSESETIDYFTILCNNKEDILWTKYFGTGTYVLFGIALIYYIDSKK